MIFENKVYALGLKKDTYLRFYPNPGFGIRFGARRIAVSWYGGIEWFHKHPVRVWVRRKAFLSRVQRPGGV